MMNQMSTNKLLTVSVAAFNAEDTLHECLDSLLDEESFRDSCEVIIVNDGSRDATLGICQDYCRRYPNTVRVINKKNGGYGSTINESLSVAEGKYFKLLDADDWYDTSLLKMFIKRLRESNADMIISPFAIHKIGDTVSSITDPKEYIRMTANSGDFREIRINHFQFTMHSLAFRTEVLKKAGIELDTNCLYTDTEFISEPISFVVTYEYIPLPIYQYRIGNTGQSMSYTSVVKHLDDLRTVILRVLPVYQNGSGVVKNFITPQLLGLYGLIINSVQIQDNVNKDQVRDEVLWLQAISDEVFQEFLKRRMDVRILQATRYSFLPLLKRIQRKRLGIKESVST